MPPDTLQPIFAGGKPLIDFLEKDRCLLRHRGLNEDYSERLIGEMRAVLERGRAGMGPPDEMFKALVRLKLCLVEARNKKAHKAGGAGAGSWPAASTSGALALNKEGTKMTTPLKATIPATEVRTIKSRNVNQEYRVSVALPNSYLSKPRKRCPTIYLVDANWFFGMVRI